MQKLIKWLEENSLNFRLVTMSNGKKGIMILLYHTIKNK
jgi:hypothetical protein